jgi:transposase-like protein
MAKQRNYSTEFKRQVVLEHLAGETLYGLSKRHDVSRNVIRLWIARYEVDGDLNDDTTAGDLLQDYKARIAALERLAGKLALENEFLKGALENARLARNAPSSVVAGPGGSRSPRDAE